MLIDAHEIVNQESLINTLLGYKAGEKVKITLERDGKRMELTATLGKRPSELMPKGKGGGSSRGDMQNSMGSALSERRTGIPRFFQTDAVVKPTECGGPGGGPGGTGDRPDHRPRRAHRELGHPGRDGAGTGPGDARGQARCEARGAVATAREALQQAEQAKAAPEVVSEARRILNAAVAEEQWWKDHPLETAPAPREVLFEAAPTPRAVNKK